MWRGRRDGGSSLHQGRIEDAESKVGFLEFYVLYNKMPDSCYIQEEMENIMIQNNDPVPQSSEETSGQVFITIGYYMVAQAGSFH